jgi:hypothetical protein
MTSGASATNSAAYLRYSSLLAAPQRRSIRTLRPTAQPVSWRPCRNAARRTCPSASSAAKFMSTPMCRTRSACCARAASGHVAAAPPSRVMRSRRLMGRAHGQGSRAKYSTESGSVACVATKKGVIRPLGVRIGHPAMSAPMSGLPESGHGWAFYEYAPSKG